MTTLTRAALPISMLALVLGCKSNNIKTSEDNDYVSQMIDAKGGTLTLDDASVYIPVDALAQPEELRLGRVGAGYPALQGLVATSPVYSLEPHEVAFQQPVTLSIAHVMGSIFFAPAGGMWMDPMGSSPSGIPTAQTMNGGFFAAVQPGQGNTGMGGKDVGGPGSMMGDGMLVRSGVGGPNGGYFSIGDTHAFYVSTATDAFGVETTGLFALALDTMDAPMSLGSVGGGLPGDNTLQAIGEYAYWTETMGPGGDPMATTTIRRMKPGGASEVVATTMGMSMGGITAANGSLMFLDSSKQVTLYDSASGQLDPTAYGTLDGATGLSFGGGPPFTRSADHVFFLTGGQGMPYEIWAGPVGSPAVDTGMNFPAGAMVLTIGGVGSKLVVVTLAGTQENFITFDTASPTSPPATIATVGNSGAGGNQMLVIDAGFAYIATFANNGPTGDLVKIDLNDGTQTPIGKYLAQGGARPVHLNANHVFVLQPSQTGDGQDIYQWAR